MKILFLGHSGTGKSSLISRFCHPLDAPDVSPTIGIDCVLRTMNFGRKIHRLRFFDTSGNDCYKNMLQNYINNAHIIVLVYDITDIQSFRKIKQWLNVELNRLKPIVIIGNKLDKLSERRIPYRDGFALAKENIFFTECSSLTGENCKETLQLIISEVRDYPDTPTIIKKTSNCITV
jgi:small GTP-binding protein